MSSRKKAKPRKIPIHRRDPYTVYREQQREAKRESKAKGALRAFHPKKSDRGRYVFIRPDGRKIEPKRAPTARGYLVYVTRTGAKRPVKQTPGLREKVVGRAKRLKSYQVDRLRYKKAAREFLESGEREFKTGTIRGNPLSLGPTCKLWSEITRWLKHPGSSATMLVRVMLRGYANGELITVESTARIDKPRALDASSVREWCRRNLYASMAKEMKRHGIVGRGSSDHIRKLRENRGKRKAQWTVAGMPWRGRESDLADWRQADFVISHLYFSAIAAK